MANTVVTEKEGAVAPSTNAADTITMSRDDFAKMLNAAADQALAKAAALNTNTAPKSMRPKIADGFIKEDRRNNEGEVIKRYRVDGVLATKIMELDMETLRWYEENPDELPFDNEGYRKTPRACALKKGKFISVLGGRIAARSENQVEQLEWMKTLSEEQGGLPGLYEVTEEIDLWQCNTCQPPRPFRNKQDWEAHRQATHGIAPERAA